MSTRVDKGTEPIVGLFECAEFSASSPPVVNSAEEMHLSWKMWRGAPVYLSVCLRQTFLIFRCSGLLKHRAPQF